MGTNKALLRVNEEETLISRVVRNLRPLSDDLIVVSNSPDLYSDLGPRLASDQFPGAGPLAGLHAGLRAAARDWALVVACDMPLVDHRLVRYMILHSEGHDAVVPRHAGELEPLHALYSKRCLPFVEERLRAGQRRVVSFYGDVRVRYVETREIAIFDPEGRSFFNANTPEDWQRLHQLLRAEVREQTRGQAE